MAEHLNLQSPIAASYLQQIAQHARLTPATLAAYLDPSWIPAEWLMYTSLRIAQAIRKGNGRLIISVPPRHGKSRLSSIGSSVWALENFPDRNIIIAAYGAELSSEFSGPIRDIIRNNEDKLTVRLKDDTNRIDRYKTTKGGGLAAVGLGGAITGRGADILFVDDFIKEIKDAESQTQREYHWKWFQTVAMTRLEPNATVIIVATRWHKDDLIGRILNTLEGWEYIRLPAIAEKNDLIGRPEGAPLFPERFDKKRLMEMKVLMGSHYFNAIYQQDPESDETNVTNPEWLKVIGPAELPNPNYLSFVRVWDLAGTAEAGDYTAWLLAAKDTRYARVYMLDCGHKQMSPQNIEKTIAKKGEEDGPSIPVYIEQEPGSAGKNLIHQIKTHVLPGHMVYGVPTTSKKLVRATPFLAGCEAGRVYMLQGPWNKDFKEEFRLFPDVDHDDMVDTASIAWQQLIGDELGATWGRVSAELRRHMEDQAANGNGAVTGAVWGRKDPRKGHSLGSGSSLIFRL